MSLARWPLLVLFFSLVVSAVVTKPQTAVFTTEQCFTRRGSVQVDVVPTTTTTIADAHVYTVSETIHPTTTAVAARPTTTFTTTKTSTNTHTTLRQTGTTTVTPTHTVTTTDVTTTRTTDTSTVTVTRTAKTISTTVEPTVAGFTPIASERSVKENGGGTYVPIPNSKRSASRRRNSKWRASKRNDNETATYPNAVFCYMRIDTITSQTTTATGTSTDTVVAPMRPATRSVTMFGSTNITPAETPVTASSTITTTRTVSSTATAATTTTTTMSTTVTALRGVATRYAACEAANTIDEVGGTKITHTHQPGLGEFLSGFETPESCCEFCQYHTECAGYIYNPAKPGMCTTVVSVYTKCSTSDHNWTFFRQKNLTPIVVGNGFCGQGTFTS